MTSTKSGQESSFNQLKFNQLWKTEKWTELREYLFKCLEESPDSHWLLTQISDMYYLEDHFNEALEYAQRAFELAPNCPMTIWQYAESLLRLGNNEEAEPLYRKLIRKGVKCIDYGVCGEGIRDARTLVNDSKYALSFILANKGDFKMAKRYIMKHIANRGPNCTSRFKRNVVNRDLALIMRGEKPHFDPN
jgi:tetratricopeptide (TPR) repeat protein